MTNWKGPRPFPKGWSKEEMAQPNGAPPAQIPQLPVPMYRGEPLQMPAQLPEETQPTADDIIRMLALIQGRTM